MRANVETSETDKKMVSDARGVVRVRGLGVRRMDDRGRTAAKGNRKDRRRGMTRRTLEPLPNQPFTESESACVASHVLVHRKYTQQRRHRWQAVNDAQMRVGEGQV